MIKNKTQNQPQEVSLLQQVGLSPKEAKIYEILLKLGKVPVNKIVPEAGFKRSTTYSVLDELVSKGLVEKDESREIIQFRAKPVSYTHLTLPTN